MKYRTHVCIGREKTNNTGKKKKNIKMCKMMIVLDNPLPKVIDAAVEIGVDKKCSVCLLTTEYD